MSENERHQFTHTLCFLVKDDEVLLAMKKRGFGEGKWNGLGGKVKENETPEEAAVREAQEEANVTLTDLKHTATITFTFPEKPEWDELLAVYMVNSWEGEPQETDEMNPKWFKKNEIPLSEMWEADALWLPKLLAGQTLKAHFLYSGDQELIKTEFISALSLASN